MIFQDFMIFDPHSILNSSQFLITHSNAPEITITTMEVTFGSKVDLKQLKLGKILR